MCFVHFAIFESQNIRFACTDTINLSIVLFGLLFVVIGANSPLINKVFFLPKGRISSRHSWTGYGHTVYVARDRVPRVVAFFVQNKNGFVREKRVTPKISLVAPPPKRFSSREKRVTPKNSRVPCLFSERTNRSLYECTNAIRRTRVWTRTLTSGNSPWLVNQKE